MVYGIEKFKEYFSDYTGQYVFIGGTACSILLEEIGTDFRATKDLDIVLIIEALHGDFISTFWRFIEDGGYAHKEQSSGKEQFYRFTKPSKPGFPTMIELFSRKPEGLMLRDQTQLTPIPTEDNIASLSAILLNDEYYDLLIKGKAVVDGYSVLGIEYIILFKIRAWLDLMEHRTSGELVDSRDLNKHKNDIFRLMINVSPAIRIHLNDGVKSDLQRFFEEITKEKIDLKNLGIRSISLQELLERMMEIYQV